MENEYSSQQCHNFVYFCTRWRRECKHFAQNRIFITVVLSGTRCAVTELSRVHYSEGMSTIVRSQILTTLLYHLLVPQIKGASHGFNCIKMEVLFYRHFTLPDWRLVRFKEWFFRISKRVSLLCNIWKFRSSSPGIETRGLLLTCLATC